MFTKSEVDSLKKIRKFAHYDKRARDAKEFL